MNFVDLLPMRQDVIVMQFTGLHDKNGKEIYEGDILYENCIGGDDKGQVVFMDGSFDLLSDDGAIGLGPQIIYGKYEVIGNIYENPELLEVAP